VLDLVPNEPRVFPVGRLDRDTEGLIVMTNDGDLAQLLAHPRHGVEKEYLAEVEGTPSPASLRQLRDGVELDDGMTAPARVKRLAPDLVEITIHEGRKRQVRRMLEAVGHPVAELERVAFGPLWLKGLEPGAHRRLTAQEIERLRGAGRPRRGRR
jgi:23S rRNA pseudouridine2605 synthase